MVAARSSRVLALCRFATASRLTITLLGRHSIACGVQQIASQVVQTGFVSPLFSGFNDLLSFGEAIQALRRLRQLSVRSGEVPRRLLVVRHLDASSEVSLFSVRTNISINDLLGAASQPLTKLRPSPAPRYPTGVTGTRIEPRTTIRQCGHQGVRGVVASSGSTQRTANAHRRGATGRCWCPVARVNCSTVRNYGKSDNPTAWTAARPRPRICSAPRR